MKNNIYTKTYILLDAHAIIHRAYHALPDFSTRDGLPTGALFGVVSMVLRVLEEFKPDHIIACYDLPEKTFRHVAYEAYKGTRKKTDDVLVDQLIRSREIFEAFNIPIYDAPGFEADDVLGTLATLLSKDSHNKIIIASGDMDTMQLIKGDQVVVYTLKKGLNDTVIYTEKDVLARYGFLPQAIPDYKGLRGDPSDNIIGVSGVGEKTATMLIMEHKNLETLYRKLDDVKKPFTQVGITPRIVHLLKENKDEAFFSKELATIRCDVPLKYVETNIYKEIFDLSKALAICEKYEFKAFLARLKKLASLENTIEDHTQAENLEVKSEALHDPVDPKYLLALSLLDSEKNKPTEHDFYSYSISKDKKEIERYIDQDITKNNLDYIWRNIEIPLYNVVKKMEHTGITLDVRYLKNLSKIFHEELTILEKNIYTHAGKNFNINSPKQLGEILYIDLALSPLGKKTKKTGTGMLSTRESELEKLKGLHPIIELIFEYREIQKLLSTYIDTLGEQVEDDGRIHAEFNQLGAATGRFSSSNPNLQNIPIKSERGKLIRNAFIAKEGYSFISFDYSQIELRLAALLSQEKFLIDSFNKGEDIHTSVAARMFNVSLEQVTSEMRRRAKTINFGMLYGMGVSALASGMNTTRKEAQEVWDAYRIQFPHLMGFLEKTIVDARKNKYTETLFGRKRFCKNINSPIPMIKAMNERMVINAPIQGTAADLIKRAMIDVDHYLTENKLEDTCKLVLQVHDEIIFEVKESSVLSVQNEIQHILENAIPKEFLKGYTPVPIEVHVSVGQNWGELK